MAPENWHSVVQTLLLRIDQAQREIEEAYQAGLEEGFAQGFGKGFGAAEQEMADHWGVVAENIRLSAGRPSYSERRAAELQAVGPREGDFMGKLTAEEYFGGAR